MPAKKPAFSTKIQLVAIADITPYDRNPRNNDSAVRLVRASIEQFGFKVPIILDAAHVIVCGHTRYKAAQELGLDSVPCIIADDLTPAQIKAYRLADNKVGEAAEWDLDKLAEELAGCVPDFDMAEFGFLKDVETIDRPDGDRAGASPWDRVGDASEGVMFSFGEVQKRLPVDTYDRFLKKASTENIEQWLNEAINR